MINLIPNLLGLVNARIKDESGQLIGSSKGLSWGCIAEGPGKSIKCWRRFMSFPIQDQANILPGIRGGWTMRSEMTVYIISNTRSSQHTPWNQGWMDYEI